MKNIPTLCSLLLLTSCNLTPQLNDINQEIPKAWEESVKKKNEKQNFWNKFGDEKLNYLISEALKNNSDTLIAYQNIIKAQSMVQSSTAGLLPTIAFSGNVEKGKFNSNTSGIPSYNNSAGLGLTFDLDLFGKLRNQKKSAQAKLFATEFAAKTIQLNVISQVSAIYFNILATNESLSIKTRLLANESEVVDLLEDMVKNNVLDKSEVNKERANLNSIKKDIILLNKSIDEQNRALAVLLGKSPKTISNNVVVEGEGGFDNIKILDLMELPLPSSILENRPDIMLAKNNLIASNYDIGAAKALYFPDISLTSMLGFSNSALNSLFNVDKSGAWDANLVVTLPIIDFGKTRSVVKSAKAQKEIALINYQQIVRIAFKEVLDAIKGQEKLYETYMVSKDNYKGLTSYSDTYLLRYKVGQQTYLDYLRANQLKLQSKLELTASKNSLVNVQIETFKALGGIIN